jgi:Calcineurin-like phosphoesterase
MSFFLRQCLSPQGLVSCLVHPLARHRGTVQRSLAIRFCAANKDQQPASSSDSGDESKRRRLISFFTDVEGDRDYLNRYVKQSKVLCWRSTTSNSTNIEDVSFEVMLDFVHPTGDDMAVFGGDIWDQGGHDLWCLKQLLDLRRRYPKRFHCILGNRDTNKMRLASELHLKDYANVFSKRGTKGPGDSENHPMEFGTRGDRLKHILRTTMGSPRAFEYRRQELQELQPGRAIADDDVVESYQDHCDPENGSLIEYIEGSSLMLKFGQVAFLHGALPVDKIIDWKNLTAVMPWLEYGVSAQDVGVYTIDDWIKALGHFVKKDIDAFRKYGKANAWIEHGGYHGLYGGLIQYGMGVLPGRIVNPTLVYNGWGTRSHAGDVEPRRFWDDSQTEAMKEFFRNTGIKVICCGHQPTGELPNTIRVDVDGESHWILCCDTSYSADVIFTNEERYNPGREQSKSGRGMRAVSEVLIEQCIQSGRVLDVKCTGALSDGTLYSTLGLMSEDAKHSAEFQVGTESNLDAPCGGKWWTQASLSDGSFLLAASKGFDYWSRIVR